MSRTHHPPPRSFQPSLERSCPICPAGLGLDRDRATEGVEAKKRIRPWHQDRGGDRQPGNEVPAHHLPERLIQADAVHEHRNALRRAEEWRCRVAAIVDVGLERIALDFVDIDPVQPPVQEVRKVQRAAPEDVLIGCQLHRRWDVLEAQLDAGKGRGADDVHVHVGSRRRLGRLAERGARQADTHDEGPDTDPTRHCQYIPRLGVLFTVIFGTPPLDRPCKIHLHARSMTAKSDSTLGLPLIAHGEIESADAAIEQQVLALFDSTAPSLLRYLSSFGLRADETEDVVQEAFLSLYYHLRLGRPQTNLRGWLFKVAHNLALRQRRGRRRQSALENADAPIDPAPNPEVRLALAERARRVRSVFRALSARDRQCLFLRAEGLRYRDIARTLGLSLGGVAKSLARSMSRFVNADRG